MARADNVPKTAEEWRFSQMRHLAMGGRKVRNAIKISAKTINRPKRNVRPFILPSSGCGQGFQHASPNVLRAMKRPANEAKVLERLKSWREVCPDLAIRSSFVVGFPGESEDDFRYLLDWLDEAQLDRVGAFRFEPVEGAPANALPDPVPEAIKEERYARLMEKTEAISAARLAAKIGRTIPVIIDEVGEPDEDGDIGATGRSQADAPEIDGQVFLRNAPANLAPGSIVMAEIEDADAHDLFGAIQPAR